MLVDTHVHVAPNTVASVEMLLTQMQCNDVNKTVLVKQYNSTDNSYAIECLRRFPGQFSVVCHVDVNSPQALVDLEHWQREGAEALRLDLSDRSPGRDSLAIWRKAQELGMSVSVSGQTEKFASPEFARVVEQLPNLKLVFEHLAGMGLSVLGRTSLATGVKRTPPTDADYRQALRLANYPNTYIKIHGMGEICEPPFPYKEIPPYVKMAYDAFGPRRMMWGSNWPAVSTREGYRNSLHFTMDQFTFCSKNDLDWMFGKTALSVWKFS